MLFFLKATESRSVILEVVEGIFLRWWSFYFFGKLELGEKLVIFRFCIVRRAFGLPSHSLVDVIVLRVVPPLGLSLRHTSLFQSV